MPKYAVSIIPNRRTLKNRLQKEARLHGRPPKIDLMGRLEAKPASIADAMDIAESAGKTGDDFWHAVSRMVKMDVDQAKRAAGKL